MKVGTHEALELTHFLDGWLGLLGFSLFPFPIQDLIVELVISGCFHLTIVGIYLTIRQSVMLFFGIILGGIGLWFIGRTIQLES